MQRQLVLAGLCTCLLPLPALAAQNPAMSARPHPAASAHANAVAGLAGAARIEACMASANTLVDRLEKGDYKAATADFDATMKADLGADKLGEAWQSVAKQAGKLQGHGTPQNVMYQDHAIVTLPLHFDKANINAQVACDADGKIAGFFLRPAAAPASP